VNTRWQRHKRPVPHPSALLAEGWETSDLHPPCSLALFNRTLPAAIGMFHALLSENTKGARRMLTPFVFEKPVEGSALEVQV
jgi:hypothetical protein